MRHTFATLALAHGANIDDVATVLGHDDIAVTYRYYRKWIRTMADRLRSTLDQIGETDAARNKSRTN
jgi:integrase